MNPPTEEQFGIIHTHSGLRVNPLAMRVEDVRIEDIAHHLSQVNRYIGAAAYPFSVAQHSILVARLLMIGGASPKVELAGLLHDASEAYLGDLATPIKRDPISEGYRGVEWRIQRLIEAVFDLPYSSTDSDIVKWADRQALEREWGVLIEPNGRKAPPGVERWAAEHAEDRFLLYFAQLDSLIREQDPSHPVNA